MTAPSVSIVIPCLNEEAAIPVVLTKVSEARHRLPNIIEVIVVNDGSTDGSGRLLSARQDVRVIENGRPTGYGAALKKAFAEARGELILFMDMDDTYDIVDLEKIQSLLLERNLQVVFGNRLGEKTGMPVVRWFGNKFYQFCLRLLGLPPLEDPCTGMRLFRRELVSDFCGLPENDLSYSMALTMHILSRRMSYGEIRIVYHERIGVSKLNSLVDGWRFLWAILSNRLSA